MKILITGANVVNKNVIPNVLNIIIFSFLLNVYVLSVIDLYNTKINNIYAIIL